ncbi:hypothetical protein PLICRDRAFT_45346 [Plicaturopsis crispa FD-325 SS-3]|uniref:F-box domain-containing protein n=1 Tax=Plicaturopsis crispa FD-325 SS-3 TaxID=944288 RepID=A0A0C9SLB4_PLICR|nr:hypothetical protein PLICRDRAFT_45346 [Plicaturopsis crispa FD-325 SS-3]
MHDSCRNCGTTVVPERPPLPDHRQAFHDLLLTNEVPSGVDILRIRQDSLDAAANLSIVEAEMDRFEQILAQLACEQQNLRRRLDVNASLLSPFRRFPNELLSHIFVECLPEEAADIHVAVLRLGGVCRKWWQVAVSTPHLWASAYLVSNNRDHRPQIPASEFWLQRSGNVPLTLTAKYSIRTDPHLPELAAFIMAHAARWTHLDLTVPHIPREICYGKSKLFTSLDSLSVQVFNEHVFTQTAFQHSPRLRKVSYRNLNGLLARTPILPWSRLTHLTVCYYIDCDWLKILMEVPDLVECVLNGMIKHDSTDYGPVEAPKLRSLRVSAQDGLAFFERLVLPALQDFQFSSKLLDLPPGVLLSFLLRARCHLTRLSLAYIYILEDEFIECLHHLSSLRILEITESASRRDSMAMFRDKVIAALDRNNSTQNAANDYRECLPDLRVLNLHDLWVNTHALAAMVRSRWCMPDNALPPTQSALASLERMQFDWIRLSPIPEADLEPLRSLRNDGFDIEYLDAEGKPLRREEEHWDYPQ